MDAKQLLAYVPESAFDMPVPNPEHPEYLVIDPETHTLNILGELYGSEQPFGLDAQEELARHAVNSIVVNKIVRAAQDKLTEQPRTRYKTIGKTTLVSHISFDRPGPRKIDDRTSGLTADEMLPISDRVLNTMRNIGDSFSNQLLATGVNQIIGAADRIERGKTTVANEAGQVLRQNRQNFVRQFTTYGANATITRTRAKGGRVLSMESMAKSWTVRGHVPDWLQGQNGWDEALHELCAHYTELDAYVAAYEWCIARKLPAIPILSPSVLDQELGHVSDDGSLNCDLLICNLETNTVAPLQAKTRARSEVIQKYSDEIVLVDPQRLGLVEIENVPVSYNGMAQLGVRSRTHHGLLLTEFMLAHSSHTKGKAKHQVPKIEATFDFFDQEVLPRLQIATR